MQPTQAIAPTRSILHRDSIYGPPLHVDQQKSQKSPWIAAWNNSRGAWKSVPEINKDYWKTVEADAKNQSVPSLPAQRFRQKRVSFSTDAPALIESGFEDGNEHGTGLVQEIDANPTPLVCGQPRFRSSGVPLDTESLKNSGIKNLIHSLVRILASRGASSLAEWEIGALRMIDTASLDQILQEDALWEQQKTTRPRSKCFCPESSIISQWLQVDISTLAERPVLKAPLRELVWFASECISGPDNQVYCLPVFVVQIIESLADCGECSLQRIIPFNSFIP